MERVNEFDLKYRNGDAGPKYFFRGPNIDWGVILIKPGEEMGTHGHNIVEETFYFPEGGCEIEINGIKYNAAKGDAFRLYPNEMHNIKNISGGEVKILFIKYPYLPEDKI